MTDEVRIRLPAHHHPERSTWASYDEAYKFFRSRKIFQKWDDRIVHAYVQGLMKRDPISPTAFLLISNTDLPNIEKAAFEKQRKVWSSSAVLSLSRRSTFVRGAS